MVEMDAVLPLSGCHGPSAAVWAPVAAGSLVWRTSQPHSVVRRDPPPVSRPSARAAVTADSIVLSCCPPRC